MGGSQGGGVTVNRRSAVSRAATSTDVSQTLLTLSPSCRMQDNRDQYYVGRGGYPNAEGVMELDAAIMAGKRR